MVRLRKEIYDRGQAVPVGRGVLYSREWYKYRFVDGQFQILFDRKYHNADPDDFEFKD